MPSTTTDLIIPRPAATATTIEKASFVGSQGFYRRFTRHFSQIEDYRRKGAVIHRLDHILFTTIAASISGADDLTAVALFAQENKEWLESILDLQGKTPSESTFRTVFTLLNPESLSRCFMEWMNDLVEKTGGRVIAIDGKAQKGTTLPGKSNSFIHIVNAWAADCGLTLGQVKVDGKSNEITAIPKLIDLLDLEGAIVTIDAMGTQTDIATKIIDAKGDYILALKGNQSSLHDEVTNYFEQALVYGEQGSEFELVEELSSGHGREEIRRIYVTEKIDFMDGYKKDWRDLRTIICIVSERTIDGETSIEPRYYISNLAPDPVLIGKSIRSHWGVENKLHWRLDVALREDALKARLGHIAENLAAVRRIVMNLLSEETGTRQGIAKKRLKAAWSTTYRMKVLGIKYSS